MAIPLIALQGNQPQIDTVGAFQQGEASALNANASRMAQEKAALEQWAQIGLGVMDGNPDGQINPDRLNQIIAMKPDDPIAQHLKANPELLRTITRGSLEVLRYGQDEAKFEEAKRQFELNLANDSKRLALAEQAASGEKAPAGYRMTPEGAMEAIPGGPADPNNPLNSKKTSQNLTAGETKQLFDAQDAVTAGEATVPMIEKMIQLNQTAWDGPLADIGSQAGALVGDKNAVDTQELKNTVTAQALEQLKAVFGAMPTEGERKILLEIQGSVGQSREVRDRIYRRALEAAQRRIETNRAKAEGIQTGSYKQPGGGSASTAQPAADDVDKILSELGI